MPNEGPWITKTIIELEERIAELECMVKVFRGCIDTRIFPLRGSPCHKQRGIWWAGLMMGVICDR